MRIIKLHTNEKMVTVVSPHDNMSRRPIIGGLLKNRLRIELNLEPVPTTLINIFNTLNKS